MSPQCGTVSTPAGHHDRTTGSRTVQEWVGWAVIRNTTTTRTVLELREISKEYIAHLYERVEHLIHNHARKGGQQEP